jgi:hypothetical protein
MPSISYISKSPIFFHKFCRRCSEINIAPKRKDPKNCTKGECTTVGLQCMLCDQLVMHWQWLCVTNTQVCIWWLLLEASSLHTPGAAIKEEEPNRCRQHNHRCPESISGCYSHQRLCWNPQASKLWAHENAAIYVLFMGIQNLHTSHKKHREQKNRRWWLDGIHRPTRMCKNLKHLQATTKVMNRRSRLMITSQRKGASPSFESCTARRPPLLSHRLLKTLNAFFCGQKCHYTTS